MYTKKAYIEDLELQKEDIKEAARIIKEGGTVAFPTETVYGLGANGLDSEAVKKIFIAKGRPQDNPLIIHVASKKIDDYVKDIPKLARELMEEFWPGPLTLILKKKDIVPNETSANLDTIGIRMPDNKLALALIKESGVPIAAPSANISGRPSPTDMERCIEDLEGRVDFIIGGEKSNIGVESTIIDLTVNPPCILRPGGITLEMIQGFNKDAYIDKALLAEKTADSEFKPKAPGMKYRHYAPKAKVRVIRGKKEKMVEKIIKMVHNYKDENLKVGIIATEETNKYYKDMNVDIISLGSRENPIEIARNLFESLRAFDDKKVDIILSESFEEVGIGIAIMNRLKKACGFDIIDV